MLRRRLIISLVLVTLGLGSILFLPKVGLQDAAIYEAFPPRVGGWTGREGKANEKEKEQLDKNTDFRKMFYQRESPNHMFVQDTVDATMVLSGDDMNNSIHRPERCLLAQGFKNITPTTIEVDVGAEKPLKVTRLHFLRPLTDKDGKYIGKDLPAIMYYWFVGADFITNSHYGRTLYDIKYRLVTGTNQRWAYISLQSSYGELLRNWDMAPNSEAETDALMQDLISKTFFPIHKTEKIRGWKDVKQPEVAG